MLGALGAGPQPRSPCPPPSHAARVRLQAPPCRGQPASCGGPYFGGLESPPCRALLPPPSRCLAPCPLCRMTKEQSWNRTRVADAYELIKPKPGRPRGRAGCREGGGGEAVVCGGRAVCAALSRLPCCWALGHCCHAAGHMPPGDAAHQWSRRKPCRPWLLRTWSACDPSGAAAAGVWLPFPVCPSLCCRQRHHLGPTALLLLRGA